MQNIIDQTIKIAGAGTAGIHLSIDIDSIDHQAAPGTGAMIHSGRT